MSGLAAVLVLAALASVMVIAPLLPVHDPADVDLANSFAPPSAEPCPKRAVDGRPRALEAGTGRVHGRPSSLTRGSSTP
jgi:hypothetical protein